MGEVGFYPGGRWDRILRQVQDTPRSLSQIHAALQDGRYTSRVERVKIWRACCRLRDLGLIARTGRGLVATEQGVAALDEASTATGDSLPTTTGAEVAA